MEKKQRLQVLFQIDQLMFELQEGSPSPQRVKEINKEIAALGTKLSNGTTMKYIQKLNMTLEEYLQHKEDGKTDKEIADIYEVEGSTVAHWKKKYYSTGEIKKEKKGRKGFSMDIAEYERYIGLGLPDEKIAKEIGIVRSTLTRWKKENNINSIEIRRRLKANS